MKVHLRERDGANCWLCQRPIPDGKASIEHLKSRFEGGTDDESNLVLCHAGCNIHLGSRPLERKIRMRVRWLRNLVRQRQVAP